jgi:hypothetical protein
MRVARVAILIFLFTVMILAGGALAAQQPGDPLSAPVPTRIFTAKKIFVSNASGEISLPAGTPDLTYNEFYAAMKTWGRYEIVADPAQADLVFEIRFTFVIGTTSVNQGSGGSGQDFQFRAVIRDPKSAIVLWAFSESVRQSGNQKTGRKYFDDAMAALLDDLKKLADQPSATSGKQQN